MDFEEGGDNDIEEVQDMDNDIFGGGDDAGVQDQATRKDAVIFLVDCKEVVFQKVKGEEETQISKILSAFRSFLKSKIISSIDDKVGLIFFNTVILQQLLKFLIKKVAANPLKFNSINLVYPIDSPSADRIKESETLEKKFLKDFGFSTQDAALYECLWLCNHEFKTLDKNKYSMRIFLFTAEDKPTFKDQNVLDQTIKHARQLKDMDVQIELFPLYKKDDYQFDINKFYSQIITVDLDELNNAVMDSSQKIMDLQQRVKQKEFRKRALNRLLLEIGEEVKVGLKIFCLVNKAKKPIGKPVERKTNSLLKKKTQFLCSDTGNPLFPNQIATYFPMGTEKVPVSKEQMTQIKTFEKPGMKLIGFKPISSLKDFHNFRTSYFVYPDDEHVTGSSQFFDALINQMSQKQKLAIVRLVPRQGSTVRFCALLPQQEQYDEDHFQRPPGLHMIFLPYADDIRGLETVKQEGREVSRELLNIGKILVNALTINDFDCTNFEDPTIQKFFAHLQGHALAEQQIEEPEDLLKPDEQGLEKYNDIIKLFQESIDLECNDVRGGGGRRGGGGTRGGGAPRGGGRGGANKSQVKMDEEEEDEPKQKRGRGRGRGSTGRAKQMEEEDESVEENFFPKPSKRGGRK